MVLIRELLSRLNNCQVDYVVLGGAAGLLHGSALVTDDLDVCVSMNPENLDRIVRALRGLNPRFRMTPQLIPLPDDPAKLIGYKNLYLLTTLGKIDFLSEVSGIGTFEDAIKHSITIPISDFTCRILNLDALIASKRAAGREKDRRAVVELEVIRRKLAEKAARPKP